MLQVHNIIQQLTDLTPSKPVDLPRGTVEHLNVRRPDKCRTTQQLCRTSLKTIPDYIHIGILR